MIDEQIIQDIKEAMENNEGVDVTEWAQHYYNDEFNFNNADPTSQQRCYSEEEIRIMIEEALKEYPDEDYLYEVEHDK